MEASGWEQARDLFARALERPVDERDAFLAQVCDDAELREEVRSLLDAAERDGPLDSIAPRMASLHDVLGEHVPERVGPYVVSGRIGEGGMAVVYRAHDPRLRRDVALKFLPAFLHDHSPAADRLMIEARAASALDHPNICTIYDIASTGDDRIFIAMAYYSGGTVQDRLRDGPLSITDAVDIASQVADALDCAHAAGIIHRDIKPANIAFGERGEAKVLDFGVAVLGDDDAADAYATAGTPSYMAPEQVLGDPADRRSDVWALGVVLFEMLTGRRPFSGESRADVHDRILNEEPVGVASLRPDIPLALAAVVTRALVKDPAERFQTAAELGSALSAAVRASTRVSQARRRNAYRAAAAVGLLVSLAAIARIDAGSRAPSDRAAAGTLNEQFERGRERYYAGSSEANEAAIALFRSIVRRDSSHATARAFLAKAYAASVRPDFSRRDRPEWLDSARIHAHAAIALEPRQPAGHAALGVVHRWSGKLQDALDQHHAALALDPQYAPSMLEIGFLSHLMGRLDEAAIWLERGLALEPAVPAARQYATALYRVLDLVDEAHRHLMAGRTIAPDDASLTWETVMLALSAGDTVVARKEFDEYIQLIAAGERERMRAWYHLLIGDPMAALDHIDRVDLTNAPSYDLHAFGVAYMQTGERARGRALLRRALDDIAATAHIPDWGYYTPDFHAAHMHAALGEREEAIAALEKWLADGGGHSWKQAAQQWAWQSLGDDPRYIEIVQRSTERFTEKRARVMAELSRVRD